MDFDITKDADEMSKKAAKHIAEVINKNIAEKGHAVIGLATGSTPIGVYKELVEMHQKGEIDFSKVTTFNLDEYVVDKKEQPDFYQKYESYHGFMEEHLFKHITQGPNAMKRENIHVPNGMADDLQQECRDYEKAIKDAGGIDLQLVGIGKNGHIGFCEPGSPVDGRTSVVTLKQDTVDENTNKFGFAAPQAISMGLGTVMDAKEVLLIADGPKKAPVLKFTGRHVARHATEENFEAKKAAEVAENPSMILSYHPNAHAIIDEKAAGLMLFKAEEMRCGGKSWQAYNDSRAAQESGKTL